MSSQGKAEHGEDVDDQGRKQLVRKGDHNGPSAEKTCFLDSVFFGGNMCLLFGLFFWFGCCL